MNKHQIFWFPLTFLEGHYIVVNRMSETESLKKKFQNAQLSSGGIGGNYHVQLA